jgi:thiamine kinase-like enzyme
MVQVQHRYHEIVTDHGYPLPADYAGYADRAALVGDLLTRTRTATAPCHNDLMPGNFIESDGPGSRIWLVDYEYSGNNDPCFELGNIAGECHLDADALATLVTAYYGRPRRSRIARARLFTLVSQYGWTLWGAIQHSASQLDFDFWSWATERFDAAAAGFRSQEFRQLLTDACDED